MVGALTLGSPVLARAVCFSITDLVKSSRDLLFCPSKNYSFIFKPLIENLKARILGSVISWCEMGQQTAQAKKVYCALS